MHSVTTTEAVAKSLLTVDRRAGKYLILELGREEYGIRVLQVQEIMGIQDITAAPQTSEFVKGIINLRGKVIPVVDLRLKFGLEATDYTQRTCIIVVQGRREREPALMGVIVDGVTEVLNLADADIEDAPTFGDQAPPSYLIGLAKVKGKIKILMDVDSALTSRELRSLDALIAQTEKEEQ